jgi:uncharacterized repeat protein (TIGR03803 family)
MRSKVSIGLTTELVIFAMTLLVPGTRAAAQQEKVLHNFSNNGKDGSAPQAGLVFDAAGNLYGTTSQGGGGVCGEYCGTVFELTPKTGGGWTERVLHIFNITDGQGPGGGLTFDGAGNLYGTTGVGGAYGVGTVFELSHMADGRWAEGVLHSFNSNGKDGVAPAGGLIFDASGNLYGTTVNGGTHGNAGTVFELSPKAGGGWTERILHSFGSNSVDGGAPAAGVILDAGGNLYGTTQAGGISNSGTVFELSPAAGGGWKEKILHYFDSGVNDGRNPYGNGLILDAAGNLYGTTMEGGASGEGTVFQLSPNAGGGWTETLLHSFNNDNGTDGYYPSGGLIFDAAGNLYGMSYYGGPGSCTQNGGGSIVGCGTVFKLTPAAGGTWTETLLHSFLDNGTDGYVPQGNLIFDAAGNLYGATINGGSGTGCAWTCGTVFGIKP